MEGKDHCMAQGAAGKVLDDGSVTAGELDTDEEDSRRRCSSQMACTIEQSYTPILAGWHERLWLGWTS